MKFEDIKIEEIAKMKEEELKEAMDTEIADIKKGRKKYIEENKEMLNRLEELTVAADLVRQYKIQNGIATGEMNMEEHMQYLNNLENEYDIYKYNFGYTVYDNINKTKKTIQLVDDDVYTLYHGTSIANAQKIIKTNRFLATQKQNTIQHNKIFFAPLPKLCSMFAKLGGTHICNSSIDNRKEHIVLECALSNFYTYYTMREYFVWGNIDADCVVKILLCVDKEVIREISKEELLSL